MTKDELRSWYADKLQPDNRILPKFWQLLAGTCGRLCGINDQAKNTSNNCPETNRRNGHQHLRLDGTAPEDLAKYQSCTHTSGDTRNEPANPEHDPHECNRTH